MNSAIVRAVLGAGEAGILQQRLAYVTGTSRIEYIGKALCGVDEGALDWQIQKLTYTGTNITAIDFADDCSNFSYEWDERATYFA